VNYEILDYVLGYLDVDIHKPQRTGGRLRVSWWSNRWGFLFKLNSLKKISMYMNYPESTTARPCVSGCTNLNL